MRTRYFVCVAATVATLLLTSCRNGDPIDYDTAISLLRDRNTEPIKLTFSASPPPSSLNPRVAQAYDQLIDAHVLKCENTEGLGRLCEPGPAGDAVVQVGTTELAVIAGHWTPENVVSINRSGGGSATAEVRMRFEPSPMYRDFEAAFNQIQLASGRTAFETDNPNKTVHVSYQRYEDGWHLEGVN